MALFVFVQMPKKLFIGGENGFRASRLSQAECGTVSSARKGMLMVVPFATDKTGANSGIRVKFIQKAGYKLGINRAEKLFPVGRPIPATKKTGKFILAKKYYKEG